MGSEYARLKLTASLLLLAMAILGLLDLLGDGPIQDHWVHATLEMVYLLMCLGGAFWLWREWVRQHREAVSLRKAMAVQSADRDVWRAQAQDYLRGLGEAIARQCASWKLTPTECDVALLLLKGFSTKEIALLQDRSERTVRQHAIAVYRKGGLSGRAELSAFFLEDLLLPEGAIEPEQKPSLVNQVE